MAKSILLHLVTFALVLIERSSSQLDELMRLERCKNQFISSGYCLRDSTLRRDNGDEIAGCRDPSKVHHFFEMEERQFKERNKFLDIEPEVCRVQLINEGFCPRKLTDETFAVCPSQKDAENLARTDYEMSISYWEDYECGKMIEDEPIVFPWVVQITKFTKYPSGGTIARCIGLLISNSYILGRPDCTSVSTGDSRVSVWYHDRTSATATAREFRGRRNLLFKLDEQIKKFTDYVRPICLPFIENATRLWESEFFYISGMIENTTVSVSDNEMRNHIFVETQHINYKAERVTTGGRCGSAITVDDPNQYLCIGSFEAMEEFAGGSILMTKDKQTSLWHLVGFNHAIGVGGWKWENRKMFITRIVFQVFNFTDIQMLFRNVEFLVEQ